MGQSLLEIFSNGMDYIKEYTIEFGRTFLSCFKLKELRSEWEKRTDYGVVMLTLMLTVMGIIMIWSATMYESGTSMAVRQLVYAAVGIILMELVSCMEYHKMIKMAGMLVFLCVIMLLMVLLGFGSSVNEASRGLSIGPISFMPVEPTKIAVILFVAGYFTKYLGETQKLRSYIKMMAFCGFFAALIYPQPALSSCLILLASIIVMYYFAGGNTFAFLGTSAAGLAGAYLVTKYTWRVVRLQAVSNPFAPEIFRGAGWQPAQSLMALGSGGIFGRGIGNGIAKLNYLPELQNDYIFSIIGEELGLVGCLFVLGVFVCLIHKIYFISLRAPDMYGRLIASGMASLIAIQVVFNLLVVTNTFPSTGVSLPFISYGGSSIISLMIGLGVVLNIARNQKH